MQGQVWEHKQSPAQQVVLSLPAAMGVQDQSGKYRMERVYYKSLCHVETEVEPEHGEGAAGEKDETADGSA